MCKYIIVRPVSQTGSSVWQTGLGAKTTHGLAQLRYPLRFTCPPFTGPYSPACSGHVWFPQHGWTETDLWGKILPTKVPMATPYTASGGGGGGCRWHFICSEGLYTWEWLRCIRCTPGAHLLACSYPKAIQFWCSVSPLWREARCCSWGWSWDLLQKQVKNHEAGEICTLGQNSAASAYLGITRHFRWKADKVDTSCSL